MVMANRVLRSFTVLFCFEVKYTLNLDWTVMALGACTVTAQEHHNDTARTAETILR